VGPFGGSREQEMIVGVEIATLQAVLGGAGQEELGVNNTCEKKS